MNIHNLNLLFKWIEIQWNVETTFKWNSFNYMLKQEVKKRRRTKDCIPYWLLLPSLIYLTEVNCRQNVSVFIALSRHFFPANRNFTRVKETGRRLGVAWFYGRKKQAFSVKSFKSSVSLQLSFNAAERNLNSGFESFIFISSFQLFNKQWTNFRILFCDFRKIFYSSVICYSSWWNYCM